MRSPADARKVLASRPDRPRRPIMVALVTGLVALLAILQLRSQAEVSAFFDGLNLLPPGLVHLGCWVAGSPEPAPGPGMPAWTGLASKP